MARDLMPEVSREKPYQPEKWGPRHRAIVAYSAAGLRNKEIAAALDMTEARVSVILNDPRAAIEMERLAANVSDKIIDVHLKLKLLSHEALEEIVDEMRNSEDEKVRQKAAFGILDRAGYTPVQKHLVGSTQLPRDVADRVAETHTELSTLIRERRYSLPDIEEAEIEEAEIVDSSNSEE